MNDAHDQSDLRSKVAVLENRMDRVEEGVSNFRAHTHLMTEFVTRSDTREEERRKYQDKREKTFARYVLLVGCIPILLEILRAFHVIPKL